MAWPTRPGGRPDRLPYVREVVATDAALRQDIATARNLGISLRRFHGWEPRRWTVTDEQGRTAHISEPEYDAWEQAIQAAYDAYRGSLCDGCGQPLDECLADETRERQPSYQASYYVCLSCEALEAAIGRKSLQDHEQSERARKANQPAPPTHHRRWHVRRSDLHE